MMALVLALMTGSLASAQTARTGGGQLSILSDTQEANTRTGEVIARGNVRIDYPARKMSATAEQAVYRTREKKIILTGNVRAFQEKNRIFSDEVTYLISEGVFQAKTNVAADSKSKKQVESIYNIPPDDVQTTSSSPAK